MTTRETYEGRPCYRCGSTTRLVKTGECLCYRKAYHKERYAKQSPRKQAQRFGEDRYRTPTPCKACGRQERWTATKRCVDCYPQDQHKG